MALTAGPCGFLGGGRTKPPGPNGCASPPHGYSELPAASSPPLPEARRAAEGASQAWWSAERASPTAGLPRPPAPTGSWGGVTGLGASLCRVALEDPEGRSWVSQPFVPLPSNPLFSPPSAWAPPPCRPLLLTAGGGLLLLKAGRPSGWAWAEASPPRVPVAPLPWSPPTRRPWSRSGGRTSSSCASWTKRPWSPPRRPPSAASATWTWSRGRGCCCVSACTASAGRAHLLPGVGVGRGAPPGSPDTTSLARDCLRQLINCSEEPQVACPFRDDSYACSSHLQDREIRAVSGWPCSLGNPWSGLFLGSCGIPHLAE